MCDVETIRPGNGVGIIAVATNAVMIEVVLRRGIAHLFDHDDEV